MYYLLLIISAIIAYAFGSLSTLTIASLYVYRKNLRKLGKGNTWFSNFRRIYGLGGLLTLLLVRVVFVAVGACCEYTCAAYEGGGKHPIHNLFSFYLCFKLK